MKTKFLKEALTLFLYLTLLALGGSCIQFILISIPNLFTNFNFKDLLNFLLLSLYLLNYILVTLSLLGVISSTYATPFIHDNVKKFNTMGSCLSINAILECIIGYGSNGNALVMVMASDNGGITAPMIICIISALMCFVMAEVFSKAIKIKEDNELTI